MSSQSRNSKKWALAALASVVALAMAGCASGGGGAATATGSAPVRETLSLNVGYIDTSINGVGIIAIANQKKLWEKAGLNVTLTPFTNGPTQIQAMQSGQIDVGYIGGGATWLPATGKATIIAPSEISLGDVVLAQPNSGIKTVQDLKGKKIGYPEGGSGEMILALALKKAGLTDADVQKVVLDPPSIVTAFVGKQIDAAAIFSPLSDQITTSVPGTLTIAKDADFPGTSFLGAWVASNDAVKSKANAIERFLEVYIQANDFRIADTKQTVEWAAEASGAPVKQMIAQAKVSGWTKSSEIEKNNSDGTTFGQFKSLEEVFVKIKRMDAVNDPSTFVNTKLFSQAMEALK
ncbi:MAG: aliphatic sulfonate ABC transporter substrate-binding protein [Lacisediminihabitans sp.]